MGDNFHCGTIIICRNRFLLVKGRESGKWSFPKGHIKQGETCFETAIRETIEETSIDLTKLRPKKFWVWSLKYHRYFIYEFWERPREKIADEREIEDIGWFDIDNIEKMRGKCNMIVKMYFDL